VFGYYYLYISIMANVLALKEEDLKLMLAAHCHHGTKNVDAHMQKYIWRRKPDGVYLINLGKTWEKILLAARIIVAIENPDDVIVVSARPYGQRAVFKFAQHTGASYIGGRYTPGTFTNQIQRKFLEPRLLIVTDPITDHQPVKEASYVNVPTIAFCDTDAQLSHVDVAIPVNNKSIHSIALMYWLLAREVNRMRGTISRNEPWGTMVDLFMYRDPEEDDKKQVEEEAPAEVSNVDADQDNNPAFDMATGGRVTEWGAPEETADAGAGAGAGAFGQAQAPPQQNWDQQGAPAQENWQPAASPSGWE